jgi:branched-chain amino acid transport system permease protein
MGIHTTRYKTLAWTISAFFLGFSGAIFGNIVAFIDPRNVAFPTLTFGIYMVLMVLLGGKGTLWGPIIGAVVFDVIKEVTWTYFLGWQNVVLGGLIIVIVVFFEQGIVGSIKEWRPEWFGIRVVGKAEPATRAEMAAASKAEAAE